MTNKPTPTNPLPSELREKIQNVFDNDACYLVCDDCYGGGHDYDNSKSCEACNGTGLTAGRNEYATEKIMQLFEQEYQRRIKAAKPVYKVIDESKGIYSPEYHREVAGYNNAIDQYEHNLKQPSEGDK